MITKEDIQHLEIKLASNLELLKNLKRDVLFNNQIERNLSENDGEHLDFNNVLEDLEDIRNELDIIN